MNSPSLQSNPYKSPWSRRLRLKMFLWQFCWAVFCRWTPKPLNPWRLFFLRLFGSKIEGRPFVHQRARVQVPWNITLGHRACLGDGANAYSLGEIILGEGCTIAQEAYLCTGTHDFTSPSLSLIVKSIHIGQNAFVGARAFVLPGVKIGDGAIVGACAVVTRNISPGDVVAGNPARRICDR